MEETVAAVETILHYEQKALSEDYFHDSTEKKIYK